MTTPALAPVGNSGNVSLGPGRWWVGNVVAGGANEPTGRTTGLDAGFRPLGYTEEGGTFRYEITSEQIEVAEELDAILYATTGRSASVTMSLAEATVGNLALALNSGAAVGNSGTSYEPPEVGLETRVVLVFDAANGARWVYRQCLQTGSVETARQKAPNKALIPVTFALEKPAPRDGKAVAPFRIFPTTTGLL